jgi:hypothetical protein
MIVIQTVHLGRPLPSPRQAALGPGVVSVSFLFTASA